MSSATLGFWFKDHIMGNDAHIAELEERVSELFHEGNDFIREIYWILGKMEKLRSQLEKDKCREMFDLNALRPAWAHLRATMVSHLDAKTIKLNSKTATISDLKFKLEESNSSQWHTVKIFEARAMVFP